MVSCWFFLKVYKGDYLLLGYLLWAGHIFSDFSYLDIKKDIFEILACNATFAITFWELKEERKMHHGGSYCYIHSHLQVKLIIQNLGFFYFQSLMNESNILNAWEYLRLSMNSVGCFSIFFFSNWVDFFCAFV